MSQFLKTGILIVFLLLPNVFKLLAGPVPELWNKWSKIDLTNHDSINHDGWDQFLGKHLISNHPSGINRLDFNKVSKEERNNLQNYISILESTKISSYNPGEQKAYWINLYNSVTVRTILDHFPVKSIREINISPGWFSRCPWDAKLISVEETGLSLNDIEHRILRPIWQDNRIHYAVNCASLGCPNLAKKAYKAENLEELLEKVAKDYVNHKRGLSFIEPDEIRLSSIYKWYLIDFGNSESNLLKHLQSYAKSELKKQLETFRGNIEYDYNWNLNQP